MKNDAGQAGLHAISWAMVLLRVALCPGIVLAARAGWDGRWLGLIVLLALLDDIYDGVLARRWGCDTPLLRRADSWADTVFYLGVAAALWFREPGVLRRNAVLLSLLLAMELLRHLFDWFKFRRAASYHSWLAKLWGLVMGVAVICALSFGGPRWLLSASLVLGILADVEGLTMSLILPRWQNDVKGIGPALRLRRQILNAAQPVAR
jgi:CDP-diacylglycerol--glycerol-3-phosphate 3-phosphatidyltransferase